MNTICCKKQLVCKVAGKSLEKLLPPSFVKVTVLVPLSKSKAIPITNSGAVTLCYPNLHLHLNAAEATLEPSM